MVRVPAPRAAPRRRPRAVHRRDRDGRARARARPRVPARPLTGRRAPLDAEAMTRRSDAEASGRPASGRDAAVAGASPSWNASQTRRNTGPGLPPPNGRPSTVVMASTSFVDDDSHISSAAIASACVTARTSNGTPALARDLERRVVGDAGQDQVVLRRRDDRARRGRSARWTPTPRSGSRRGTSPSRPHRDRRRAGASARCRAATSSSDRSAASDCPAR